MYQSANLSEDSTGMMIYTSLHINAILTESYPSNLHLFGYLPKYCLIVCIKGNKKTKHCFSNYFHTCKQ